MSNDWTEEVRSTKLIVDWLARPVSHTGDCLFAACWLEAMYMAFLKRFPDAKDNQISRIRFHGEMERGLNHLFDIQVIVLKV